MKDEKNWNRGLALSLLAFLIIGLPLFAIIFFILVVYTFFRWLNFIDVPSIELAMINILITIVTVASFLVLRKLIIWLKD